MYISLYIYIGLTRGSGGVRKDIDMYSVCARICAHPSIARIKRERRTANGRRLEIEQDLYENKHT